MGAAQHGRARDRRAFGAQLVACLCLQVDAQPVGLGKLSLDLGEGKFVDAVGRAVGLRWRARGVPCGVVPLRSGLGVSAYDLTCRSAYDLMCRSTGVLRPLSF